MVILFIDILTYFVFKKIGFKINMPYIIFQSSYHKAYSSNNLMLTYQLPYISFMVSTDSFEQLMCQKKYFVQYNYLEWLPMHRHLWM